MINNSSTNQGNVVEESSDGLKSIQRIKNVHSTYRVIVFLLQVLDLNHGLQFFRQLLNLKQVLITAVHNLSTPPNSSFTLEQRSNACSSVPSSRNHILVYHRL